MTGKRGRVARLEAHRRLTAGASLEGLPEDVRAALTVALPDPAHRAALVRSEARAKRGEGDGPEDFGPLEAVMREMGRYPGADPFGFLLALAGEEEEAGT